MDVYDFWEKEKLLFADLNSKKKKYSLLIPPPNLTGELHLGHAMQHSILDAVARFRRLQGFDVLLLPGVDHAGIQFEATLEKKLAKEGLSKEKLGREKWLAKAWEFKDEVYKSVSKTWRFMGLSADWSREVFTLDPKCQKAVFGQFKNFYEAGLIYKGPYIVQWCPKDQTAIEDVEVEYEERKEKLYYLKYLLKDKRLTTNAKKFITVATVRPETIFSDVAIAVSPKDKRYKDLVGKKVVVPFVNREIPIIGDDSIDIKFGSGALKVDPPHAISDYEIGKKNKLEMIPSVGKDGRLMEIAGQFAGLKTGESRDQISKALDEIGTLEKIEDIFHAVPVCERCKSVVEPLISEEWFVKVEGMAKEAVKVIRAGQVNFLPKNYAKILTGWLENIHDWCISRSLWWGHRIPVWYKGKETKVSFESPGEGWEQDEQVLDTWFSSGLWPLSTLGWPQKTREFEKYFPWDFEISAPEIKYLWIARMIMISNYFTGEVPFKTMFFHGMLRDLQGRKFSKSLGNGIEPQYLIDKWGVDATRMALYSYSIAGRDGRVSREILDERGKNFRNFATKIRNIAKFILELKPKDGKMLLKLNHNQSLRSSSFDLPRTAGLKDDKRIRDGLGRLIVKVTNNLERLELHLAVEELYNFIWHDFADRYIESSKNRRVEAQPTLEHVLFQVLVLLHPFMPFLTEEIYQTFDTKKKSIMMEEWPTA